MTADLAGLVALGSVVNSFRLPGIASDLSRSRQSGDVFFVTSDADGNLATTTTPVTGKTSASKSVADAPVVTNTAANSQTVSETVQPSQLNALDERDVSGLSGPTAGPLTGVSDDAIFGSNLTAEAQPVATPIAATGAAAEDVLTNTNNIAANTAAIDVNTQAITANRVLIDQAFTQIDANTAAIEESFESIEDVEQGLAAVAALPDMFLARDESFAASGGAAVFGDELGFGATLAIRGNDRWSFGASAAIGGDEATGKIQVRWAR